MSRSADCIRKTLKREMKSKSDFTTRIFSNSKVRSEVVKWCQKRKSLQKKWAVNSKKAERFTKKWEVNSKSDWRTKKWEVNVFRDFITKRSECELTCAPHPLSIEKSVEISTWFTGNCPISSCNENNGCLVLRDVVRDDERCGPSNAVRDYADRSVMELVGKLIVDDNSTFATSKLYIAKLSHLRTKSKFVGVKSKGIF